MGTTVPTRRPAGTDPTRRTALVTGILYLITFISSIPAALLLGAVADPNHVASPGADTRIAWAAVLDLVNALACIGTAVAVFSVVKREHEGLALGFVATRLFEAGVLVIGVLSILTLVTLRQAGAADGTAGSMVPVGRALVALRDWTFLIGPGMASLNALMFGTLLYRARLVPRAIPALGIVGAPILISFVVGMMVGVASPGSAWHAVAVLPFFFWELAAGLWLTLKGFDRSAPIVRAIAAEAGPGGPAAVATHGTAAATAGVA